MRHLLQAGIARLVAAVVVVALEKIHVEHDHRQRHALAHAALPFGLPHFVELAPVGQAGQAVGGAEGGEAAVGLLQLGGALAHLVFQPGIGRLNLPPQLLACAQLLAQAARKHHAHPQQQQHRAHAQAQRQGTHLGKTLGLRAQIGRQRADGGFAVDFVDFFRQQVVVVVQQLARGCPGVLLHGGEGLGFDGGELVMLGLHRGQLV